MKVKNDHHSKISNLSNWKEEAWKKKKKKKNQGFKINKLYPILVEKGNELKGFFSAFNK